MPKQEGQEVEYNLIELWEELTDLIASTQEDVERSMKGEKEAGVRLRMILSHISKKCIDMRQQVQDIREDIKGKL